MNYMDEQGLSETGSGVESVHRLQYLMACILACGKDVLDIPSGEGHGTAMLAGVARHTVGMDGSPASVKQACRTYNRDNLKFRSGAVTAISLPDSSVDLVVISDPNGLHDNAFHEIKRVLRPEGLLFVTSPVHRTCKAIDDTRTAEEFVKGISRHFAHSSFADPNTGDSLSTSSGKDGDAWKTVILASDEKISPAFFSLLDESESLVSQISKLEEACREQSDREKLLTTRSEELNAALQEREAALHNILTSRSWRLTAPLRAIGRWGRSLCSLGGQPAFPSRLFTGLCLVSGLLLTGRLSLSALFHMEQGKALLRDTLVYWNQNLPPPDAGARFRYSLSKRLVQSAVLVHRCGGILPAMYLFLTDRGKLRSVLHDGQKNPDVAERPEVDNGCIRARILQARTPEAASPVHTVFIHVSTEGNMFFQEIAQIIACGFEDIGISAKVVSVSIHDGATSYGEADLHLVIAPHEYYYFLPHARNWPKTNRVWMLNTEQAHTPWFAGAATMFHFADMVLDMDFDMARMLGAQGIRAEHLPLGYSPRCHLFDGLAPLEGNVATYGLPRRIREWTDTVQPLETPLAQRPLDCCFFGNAVERRVRFFAEHAPLFADLRAYLRLLPMTKTLRTGISTPLTTEATSGIVRRSKLAFNIHQSHHSYFEWHRIVFQGLWQGALVVSEPCTPAWPFRPNIDYISVGLDDMGEAVEYLLRSADGMLLAENVRVHGYNTLTHGNLMGTRLRELVDLYACIAGGTR